MQTMLDEIRKNWEESSENFVCIARSQRAPTRRGGQYFIMGSISNLIYQRRTPIMRIIGRLCHEFRRYAHMRLGVEFRRYFRSNSNSNRVNAPSDSQVPLRRLFHHSIQAPIDNAIYSHLICASNHALICILIGILLRTHIASNTHTCLHLLLTLHMYTYTHLHIYWYALCNSTR